ncbi:MAG: ABC transporter substrate-binding protein [Thermoplasmata archaeon]
MSLKTRPPAPSRPSIPVAWVVAIAIVAAAGGVGGTAAYYHYANRPAAAPCSPGSSPCFVNVTDDLGRSVTVPYDPARVAVFGPSIMDAMVALGLRSHVVAVDCYAASLGGLSEDYSSDQIAAWNLTNAMCVQVGPTFSLEELANASVQLVLASTIVPAAAVTEIVQTLDIPVVMLQPSTLEGILNDVGLLGEIFGAVPAATSLTLSLARELANATTQLGSYPSLPTVLVTYDTDQNGYWTFGEGTFGQSLIALAGGQSISANSSNPYPELSAEQVLAANPYWIIYGTGFGLNESSYQSAPGWSSLSAVQDGRAVGLDSNYLTEPDPTMILVGLPALIAILHP